MKIRAPFLVVPLTLAVLSVPAFAQDPALPSKTNDDEESSSEGGGEDSAPAEPAPAASTIRKVDTTSPTALALKEALSVPANYCLEDQTVQLTYDFADDGQLQDWMSKGFDGFRSEHSGNLASIGGMWMSAGSNGQGVVAHRLELKGDFEVEFTCTAQRVTSRSDIVFSIGKVGGRFGNQLVKRGTGNFTPISKKSEAKRDMFFAERQVTLRYVRKGDKLTVYVNNAKSGEATKLTDKVFDGRVGITCSDATLTVSRVSIKAKIDPTKL